MPEKSSKDKKKGKQPEEGGIFGDSLFGQGVGLIDTNKKSSSLNLSGQVNLGFGGFTGTNNSLFGNVQSNPFTNPTSSTKIFGSPNVEAIGTSSKLNPPTNPPTPPSSSPFQPTTSPLPNHFFPHPSPTNQSTPPSSTPSPSSSSVTNPMLKNKQTQNVTSNMAKNTQKQNTNTNPFGNGFGNAFGNTFTNPNLMTTTTTTTITNAFINPNGNAFGFGSTDQTQTLKPNKSDKTDKSDKSGSNQWKFNNYNAFSTQKNTNNNQNESKNNVFDTLKNTNNQISKGSKDNNKDTKDSTLTVKKNIQPYTEGSSSSGNSAPGVLSSKKKPTAQDIFKKEKCDDYIDRLGIDDPQIIEDLRNGSTLTPKALQILAIKKQRDELREKITKQLSAGKERVFLNSQANVFIEKVKENLQILKKKNTALLVEKKNLEAEIEKLDVQMEITKIEPAVHPQFPTREIKPSMKASDFINEVRKLLPNQNSLKMCSEIEKNENKKREIASKTKEIENNISELTKKIREQKTTLRNVQLEIVETNIVPIVPPAESAESQDDQELEFLDIEDFEKLQKELMEKYRELRAEVKITKKNKTRPISERRTINSLIL